MDWLKQYYLWIIAGLFCLLCLQTCKSCASDNAAQWTEMEQSIICDSLSREIKIRDKKIDSLRYELRQIQSKYDAGKITIENLKQDKEYLKEQNKTLNSNLKKTLDKNEKFE